MAFTLSVILSFARGQISQPPLSDTALAKPVKIGLVLSGGGAKCFSQIGVLKVIEEAGIEIDYIAGTSMGAIVGGLYAMGYSAAEIEHYLRSVDWNRLLTNEVPRDRLSFFDRKSHGRYLITLPIKNNKITMPAGLNYAQYILTELSFLTQQSYQYDSFSDFPTPFLCMGTNLVNGEPKVFKEGNLLEAMRASTSFPSLYVPYEIDGVKYVDGGVINNYPVMPLLREEEMDYIIGIDLQNFLYEKNELKTAPQVLEQISSFINASEEFNQRQYTDLLIEPKLPEKANITSFSLFDSIISAGEQAARQHWEGLQYLAQQQKSSHSPAVNKSAKKRAVPMDKFYLGQLSIKGNTRVSNDFIIGKLRLQVGDTVTRSAIALGMDQLYGSRYFKSIYHTFEKADTGYHLIFKVDETEHLSKVKLGLHYDQDYKSAVLLNYTTRNLLFRNARLSLDFAFGDNSRLLANYYIDRGLIPSIGFRLRSNRFRFGTFVNQEKINQRKYFDISNQLFLQSTIADAYAVGGGVELDYVNITADINPQGITGLESTYLNYFAFLNFDSFNDRDFPNHGFQFRSSYRIISGRAGIDKRFIDPSSVLEAYYSQAIAVSPKITLLPQIRGVATLGPQADAPYKVYMGSLGENFINYNIPFAGYRFRELIGSNLLMARMDVNFQFSPNHYLTGIANFAKLSSNFDELFNPNILLDGYGLGYTFDSKLGPLSFYMMSSTNHQKVYSYISLGYWF